MLRALWPPLALEIALSLSLPYKPLSLAVPLSLSVWSPLSLAVLEVDAQLLTDRDREESLAVARELSIANAMDNREMAMVMVSVDSVVYLTGREMHIF